MGDKVLVALLLELVSLMAGQLDDVLTLCHIREANRTFADRFGAKSRIDRATKMPLRPINERLATSLVRGSLPKRLRSDERKPAVVLKFVPANGVILEVIKAAELVRHEVEAKNAVLELLVVVDVGALVTAASQDGVEQEDGEASDHEDRVLQEVHDQVHVQSGGIRLVLEAQIELIFPLVLLLLDNVDGVAEDATLDEPLDERPGCEATISARLHQEAIAEEEIERIKDAETKCNAAHLCEEAQINQ